MTVVLIIVSTIISICIPMAYLLARRRRKISISSHPPTKFGWIPWIGCALQFGSSPLKYIKTTHEEFGPVFTLIVAGKRLTFLMDASYHHLFFSNKFVDFQAAAQPTVEKAVGIGQKDFMTNHTIIHDTVKEKLGAGRLNDLALPIYKTFSKYIKHFDGLEGKVDLNAAIRTVMYRGVLETLFGDHSFPFEKEEIFREIEKNFVEFDDGFEVGSSVPDIFLRKWKKSKNFLKCHFARLCRSQPQKDTVFASLADVIKGRSLPEYGLLMMWASLANAIPITFWTMCYILRSPDILPSVIDEATRFVDQMEQGSKSDVPAGLFQSLHLIRNCIFESIRLRSPGVIARKVVKPIHVKNYIIPAGHMLLVSPFWMHRDSSVFSNPDDFNPSRWNSVDKSKSLPGLNGFVAFGGGRYACPGRHFAIMEIQVMIALLLAKYDILGADKVPEPSYRHVVGVPQPCSTFSVKILMRKKSE